VTFWRGWPRFPSLGDELARALYILRPMTGDKIREAIVGPAHAKGVRFETAAMVDQLTESTAKTDSGLPLLQFALTELWEARKADVITEDSLAKIGGVTGALARHADQVLMSLPADQRSGGPTNPDDAGHARWHSSATDPG
jgi:hypothetical protein